MPPEPARAYIGLGSNVGDRLEALRSGCRALARLPGTTLAACSSVYESAPLKVRPQPDFLNACCCVRTHLSPAALLDALLAIEAGHGRRRTVAGAPRTLDLDLLLYDDCVGQDDALTLPHPRLHERAFVLYPLAELDGQLRVPGRGAVLDLLETCRGQQVARIAADLLNTGDNDR